MFTGTTVKIAKIVFDKGFYQLYNDKLKFDIACQLCYNINSGMGERGDGLADKNTLGEIKKIIEGYLGQRVTLKANKGRKRIVIREGILEDTYPSIFVVKVYGDFDTVRRVSYSYCDILTETVEITVCEDNRQIKVS
jgi:uncharacterized protein Veg